MLSSALAPAAAAAPPPPAARGVDDRLRAVVAATVLRMQEQIGYTSTFTHDLLAPRAGCRLCDLPAFGLLLAAMPVANLLVFLVFWGFPLALYVDSIHGAELRDLWCSATPVRPHAAPAAADVFPPGRGGGRR